MAVTKQKLIGVYALMNAVIIDGLYVDPIFFAPLYEIPVKDQHGSNIWEE